MSSSSSANANLPEHSRSSVAASHPDVGVQELIDRLKAEGVQEGQQQAQALLAEAKQQAARIVDAARAEADTIVQEAQQEATRTQTNGRRALALASRDASLQLKEQLQHEFRGWIGKLVRAQLDDPEFLADLIRAMASQAMASIAGDDSGGDDHGSKLTFLVDPQRVESVESFVAGQAAEMLRHGVRLHADPALVHGFRVQIVANDVEINFSDEAVTAALMRFLAPKFRQQIGLVSEDS